LLDVVTLHWVLHETIPSTSRALRRREGRVQ